MTDEREPDSTAEASELLELDQQLRRSIQAYAVGVWDASGSIQLGFVPREYSEHVAVDIASGIPLEARTLREFSRTSSGPRLGIHILIFPAGPHQIVIDVDHDAEQSNSQPSAWLTR